MSYTLNTEQQSLTLYLDSTNCIQRSPSFKYSLASSITCPINSRLLVSVSGFSMPNVIFNITEFNNKLSYKLINQNTGNPILAHTVTFPVGIYSATSFVSYYNTQPMKNGNPAAVTMIFNQATFSLTFISTFLFRIIDRPDGFVAHPTTCGHLIGVAKDENNKFIFPINASNDPAFTLNMPSTINFNPSPYIFLKIANIKLNNINSFGVINDTLIRIPVNSNYGEMIQYRPAELNRFILNTPNINTIELRLEDINNNPLAIPSGVEIQVILKIDYIYTPEPKDLDIGTISRYFKENPIDVVEEEDELGAI